MIDTASCHSYPELKPSKTPAKKLVILLHGYGSDGDGIIGLASIMGKNLPFCHFIAPHGIEPFEFEYPGRQWFSLIDRNPVVLQGLLAASCQKIKSIILTAQRSLSLSNRDTIIIGFSQGAMLGLYSTLIQSEPFAAMIGFSGLLIPPLLYHDCQTPICLVHGECDTVVPIIELQNSIHYLNKNNIMHESLSIPNLDHSINETGVDFVIDFIKRSISIQKTAIN